MGVETTVRPSFSLYNTRDEIDRFLTRPAEPRRPPERMPVPPGDPIGGQD